MKISINAKPAVLNLKENLKNNHPIKIQLISNLKILKNFNSSS